MKRAEKLAKILIDSKFEDRSTLVNDSYILRDAIGQVQDFLESIRALKVMVNYWNLIFALLGKELVITRDPENQRNQRHQLQRSEQSQRMKSYCYVRLTNLIDDKSTDVVDNAGLIQTCRDQLCRTAESVKTAGTGEGSSKADQCHSNEHQL